MGIRYKEINKRDGFNIKILLKNKKKNLFNILINFKRN
jgi:hypothetical protein